MQQPRQIEESKEVVPVKNENDGGSGGTTKIELDEEEDQQAKTKKKLEKEDVFETTEDK